MGYRDITVLADSIELIEKRPSSYGGSDLQIDLVNADIDNMLSDIGIDEAIGYFGDDLLELIGKDKAIEYFGIEEKE